MQEQDYITFEAYLSRALPLEEQMAFQKRLQEDEAYKLAFKTYKEASGFLEHNFKNEEKNKAFKANLEKVSSSYFNKQEAPKGKRIQPWYYSVAIAAILVIGFFIKQQFSSPVYSDFANYETISLTVRGTQSNMLNKAETAFNAKNYKDAEAYFTALIKLDSNNLELQLYQAVSLVELDAFKEADAIFMKIINSPSVYSNKAKWYLALSKLKQEDTNACLNVLQTIPEDADDYKQAQKLIKKLD